ncbi:uncharacterized protein LOC123322423 [Coccinella septempunctata]|uniref:uncharacterized protein LOC123322423 n=1 Tax=Coccinella septempunctata TaxID=41139 RepID=UPI001D076173|nr:uncharacterized protein LOC123322423 [Coccinella septempunctata]
MEKCFKVTFTRKSQPINFGYRIGDHFIAMVEQIHDLGVLFDSTFSFIPHIEEICTKASRTLGFVLRATGEFEDLSILRRLYFTYVISKLEYANLIWFPIYNCHLVPLERIHRKFFKYIIFRRTGRFPERGADLSDIMVEMRIPSLLARREEQCARFAQRLLTYRIDCPYLLSKIMLNIPRLVSRSTSTFYLPTARTNMFERCPIYSICRSADRLGMDVFG